MLWHMTFSSEALDSSYVPRYEYSLENISLRCYMFSNSCCLNYITRSIMFAIIQQVQMPDSLYGAWSFSLCQHEWEIIWK